MPCDYRGDGLGVKNRSLDFMQNDQFDAAWERSTKAIMDVTESPVPDVRWRAHIALWAAVNGLRLEGDFVECGVFTGILSSVICHYLNFNSVEKHFYLFDTWNGVPTNGLDESERKVADLFNPYYHEREVFDGVRKNFSTFQNCHLVRGELPGTLSQVNIEKISYLSIDLNNATFERACIEILWPMLTSGAIAVLDDYNFSSCHLQRKMWDDFAADQHLMVAALPTGQGILIKP